MRSNAVLSSLILFCKGTIIQKEIKVKWKFLWGKLNQYLVLIWLFRFFIIRDTSSRRWNGSITVMQKFIAKVLLCQKCKKKTYSGRNNINHISLTGPSLFPEYSANMHAYMCQIFKRSWGSLQSKHPSSENFISNSSHKRYTSYIEEMYSLLLFICNQKYHRRISPQREGC